MSRKKCSRSCGIGGQAVLEGVMMKKGDLYAVTVRKPDGELVIDTEEFHGVMHGNKIKNVPFIRGIFNFVDSLILGTRTLTYSADFFEDETAQETAMDRWFKKKFKDKAESVVSGLTVALSIVLAIGIFMVLPYFISSLLDTFVRNTTILAIIEGIIRLAIFVGYVVLISAMEDIKRVYMYHGAEHKCINCIERGHELTVENAMKSSRLHKRCGTSFMLFVMMVSIVMFMFISVENPVMRVVVRILLVPVIAGISYEIIRLAGNNSNNILVRIISAPGMWLQTLTTKEPTEDMVEVAIKSVEAVFDWREYLKEEFGYGEEAVEEDDEINAEDVPS